MKQNILILIVVMMGNIFAQTGIGSLKGKVFTSDGKPAELVNISVKGTTIGVASDNNGEYVIREIEAGKQVLIVSFIGLKTKETTIEIISGKQITVPDIILEESYSELQEIVVLGNRTNKFAEKETDFVARMPLKNIENPQVYSVITKELLQEQVTTDIKGALSNAPGANYAIEGLGSGGIGVNVFIRGFSSFTALRNGMATNYVTMSDPANLERIEILKGPSATLFGSTLISYGGLVNRITKKPYEFSGGEISYTGGSWDLSRFVLDLNMPLNEDKTMLLRLNAANHWERSFQDFGSQRNRIIEPSFLYKISDKLKLSLDVELFQTKRNSTFWGIGNGVTANSFNGISLLDYNSSFSNNDFQSEAKVYNVFAKLEYRISDNWITNTNYSFGNTDNNANYLFVIFTDNSHAMRRLMDIPSNFSTVQLQQNLVGKLNFGKVKNKLLLGVDYYELNTWDRRAYVNFDVVDLSQPIPDINVGKYHSAVDTIPRNPYVRDQHTISVYASDVVSFFDEKLITMLSLRVDHLTDKITDYEQTALSPKLGIVYQILKDQVSVFANYMNGFVNIPPGENADETVKTFKPEQANQIEGGFKFQLFRNKLSANISYYNIKVEDVLRADPDNPGYSIQDGTQVSKGYEVEIIANPATGFNLVAGYSYNDSKYTQANASVKGNRPLSTPEHSLNFWTSYKISAGNLNGLGIGLGGNYVSESFMNDANTFKIDAYKILNTALFYDTPSYRLDLKFNNITNEKYWISNYWAMPQKPANLLAGITYKF